MQYKELYALTRTFVDTQCSVAEHGVWVGNVFVLCVTVHQLSRTERLTSALVVKSLTSLQSHAHTHTHTHTHTQTNDSRMGSKQAHRSWRVTCASL